MSWLTNYVRPKIRALVTKKEVPDNLWTKCPQCETMLFHRDLENNMNVCTSCQYHLKVDVYSRLELLFDNGKYDTLELPKTKADPLKFRDRKKYKDRLKESRQKTGRDDVLVVARGKIGGVATIIAAFDFSFMGGSMGAALGDGLLTAASVAVEENAAFISVPASGGARMQEGMLSLMQMPRSVIAVETVKDAGLPYIVLLTDPTTGGVSASFAMLGDIHIAEPGAMVGFAGRRVIQETIREDLPDGFQTAEYLLEHGMVDMVVHRKDLNSEIGKILNLLQNKIVNDNKGKNKENGKKNKKKKAASASSDKTDAAES